MSTSNIQHFWKMVCTVNSNGIYFPNDLIWILQLTILNLFVNKMTNFTHKMLIASKPLKIYTMITQNYADFLRFTNGKYILNYSAK